MRKLSVLLVLLLLPFALHAGNDDLKYDVESAGVSASGMTLIKLSLYVSKPKNATTELLKKAAVHAIIFRGVAASSVTGFSKQQPLASSPAAAQQYGDYFETFFADGGAYMSYAQIVDSSTQTVKMSKKEYRVSVVVNVSTDQLRRTLKEAGVIKGMTDGF